MSSTTADPDEINQRLSSQIHNVSSVFGKHPMQHKIEQELTHAIRGSIDSVRTRQSNDLDVLPPLNDQDHGEDVLSKRKCRRVFVERTTTVTRSMLCEIHCTVSTYRNTHALTYQNPGTADSEPEDLVTSFVVVPSWWVVKLGLSKTYAMDITSPNNQGWQANISTFNVSNLP